MVTHDAGCIRGRIWYLGQTIINKNSDGRMATIHSAEAINVIICWMVNWGGQT